MRQYMCVVLYCLFLVIHYVVIENSQNNLQLLPYRTNIIYLLFIKHLFLNSSQNLIFYIHICQERSLLTNVLYIPIWGKILSSFRHRYDLNQFLFVTVKQAQSIHISLTNKAFLIVALEIDTELRKQRFIMHVLAKLSKHINVIHTEL